MDFLMRMRRHPQAGRMCRFCQAQAGYLAEPKEIGSGTAWIDSAFCARFRHTIQETIQPTV